METLVEMWSAEKLVTEMDAGHEYINALVLSYRISLVKMRSRIAIGYLLVIVIFRISGQI